MPIIPKSGRTIAGALVAVSAVLICTLAGASPGRQESAGPPEVRHAIPANLIRTAGLKEELEKLKAKANKDKAPPPAAGNDPGKPGEVTDPSPQPSTAKPSGSVAGGCDPKRDLVIELGKECSNGPNREVFVVNKTSRVIDGSFRTYQRQKDGHESRIEQSGGIGAHDKARQLCGTKAEVLACRYLN